jgi:ABC-type bacteriocin/lantibiotic exporter with double-glycine peptidase domain
MDRLIVDQFRADPRRLMTLIGLALVIAASAVVPPLIVAKIVDRAIAGSIEAAAVAIAAAGILALAAGDGVLTLIRRRLAIANQIDTRARMAREHFRFCVRLPLSEYREGNHAALIRSFDDLDTVIDVVAANAAEFFANVTIVVSYAVLMLAVEPRLALVFFALAGASFATTVMLTRATRTACESWLPWRDSRFAYIVECLTSMLTIKTLSAHGHVSGPFAAEQSAENQAFRIYRNRGAAADAMNRFWSIAIPGVGAAVGAVMLIAGQLTAGTLVLFLSVSGGLVASLTAIHFEIERFQDAAAAVTRMRTVSSGQPEPLPDRRDAEPPSAHESPVSTLAAADVDFRHHGAAAETLDRLNLTIRAGEHIAIVARSGEGKTTLAYLLARLYEPTGGVILTDAGPSTATPLDRHRRKVIVVPHVVDVFSASVRDNVRLWDPEVSDAAIRSALALAGLADTVDAFAGGLGTVLGTRGNPLSAGQRQRLGLARAFLRSPDVLILDEATSALDAETERQVLDNVRAFMRDRILIAITHRAHIAASLDRIVRMVNGRAAESVFGS